MSWTGRMKKWYANSSIRNKIVLMLLLVIGLLILTGSILFYVFVRFLYFGQVEDSVRRMSDQARDELENQINIHYYTSYVVQNSEAIQEIMMADAETFQEQYANMMDAEELMVTLTLPVSIYQISLYVRDDVFYANNNWMFRKMGDLDVYEEVRGLKESPASYVWLPPEKMTDGGSERPVEVISFIRKIGSNTEPVGYQRVSMRVEGIKNLLMKPEDAANGYCYIVNENTGNILCQNTETDLSAFAEEVTAQQKKLLSDRDWIRVKIGGHSYYIYARRVKGVNWIMFSVLPARILYLNFLQMFFYWMIIILMVGSLALYLAYAISRNITSRISLLEKNMNMLTQGHFERLEMKENDDEIGLLVMHYNETIDRILSMAKKEYETLESLKTAELKALQAQINPHFLYNTLDLIFWKAMDAGAQEMAEVVRAFARFYKLSLNGGRDRVAIRDEIEHIRCYLEVQNYRFDDYIKYNIELPDELCEYEIVKITLQPLIENAIIHGLSTLKGKKETRIKITGERDGDVIQIIVRDNGIGIPEERLQGILDRPTGKEQHGYGVYNINERLRIYYGDDCGLFFESRQGEGTTVRVRIRAVKYQVEK